MYDVRQSVTKILLHIGFVCHINIEADISIKQNKVIWNLLCLRIERNSVGKFAFESIYCVNILISSIESKAQITERKKQRKLQIVSKHYPNRELITEVVSIKYEVPYQVPVINESISVICWCRIEDERERIGMNFSAGIDVKS